MIQKLDHIGIMVKDAEASLAFYTEIIGMSLQSRVELADGTQLIFLEFPGSEDVQLELVSRGHDGLSAEGIVHHIAFTVSDIDATLERLKQAGVQLLDVVPREIAPLNGAKIAFLTGPDGEHIELFQPGKD